MTSLQTTGLLLHKKSHMMDVSKHIKLGSKSQHYRPTSLVYKAIIVKDCLAEYDLNKRRGKGSNLRICKASSYL